MIWLSPYNPEAPINLFQQNDPHQLMWKRHCRKTELLICSGKHLFRKPQGTSDYKTQMAISLYRKRVKMRRQVLRRTFRSLYSQRNYIRIFFDCIKNPSSLFFSDLPLQRFSCSVRRLFICGLNDIQRAIPAQPFAVL